MTYYTVSTAPDVKIDTFEEAVRVARYNSKWFNMNVYVMRDGNRPCYVANAA